MPWCRRAAHKTRHDAKKAHLDKAKIEEITRCHIRPGRQASKPQARSSLFVAATAPMCQH